MRALQRLCARQRLQVERDYPRALPALLRLGLGGEEAVALAYNAAVLRYALDWRGDPPGRAAEVLDRLSLEEMAWLCEEYLRVERGEVEYGASDCSSGE